MKNIIKNFEKEQIKRLTIKKNIPNFRAGDTIKVNVKVTEGERSRIQAFEGVCIAKKNAGLNSSFTIRKISYGEGIERIFPFFSPSVDSIKIIKQGDIKRAKLYYLRKRSGKNTRIADKNRGEEKDLYELTNDPENNINKEEGNDNQKENNKENKLENKEQIQEKKLVEKQSQTTKTESNKSDNESKS